jgi:two-component system response regulator ArlR
MKKLLLIEDDKQLSHMYLKKFSNTGWDVTVAHDGSEGIQTAGSNVFDAIVLDIMLPGLSGIDVLEILRSNKKTAKVPIIVYTNYGEPANKEKCLIYGADEFLLKINATPLTLCNTVERITALKSVKDEKNIKTT